MCLATARLDVHERGTRMVLTIAKRYDSVAHFATTNVPAEALHHKHPLKPSTTTSNMHHDLGYAPPILERSTTSEERDEVGRCIMPYNGCGGRDAEGIVLAPLLHCEHSQAS